MGELLRIVTFKSRFVWHEKPRKFLECKRNNELKMHIWRPPAFICWRKGCRSILDRLFPISAWEPQKKAQNKWKKMMKKGMVKRNEKGTTQTDMGLDRGCIVWMVRAVSGLCNSLLREFIGCICFCFIIVRFAISTRFTYTTNLQCFFARFRLSFLVRNIKKIYIYIWHSLHLKVEAPDDHL